MRRFVFFAWVDIQGDPDYKITAKQIEEMLATFVSVQGGRQHLATAAGISSFAELAPDDMPARPDKNLRTLNPGNKAKH